MRMDMERAALTAEEKRDIYFMGEALKEAKKAAKMGETPVGAVVVVGDDILTAACNRRERELDVAAHAELTAIRLAAKKRGNWRLQDATLYVTLEPCPMCAGAILASRIGRVVYGAKDATAGAMGSVLNLPRYPLGAHPTVVSGVLEEECRTLLQQFFKEKRKKI